MNGSASLPARTAADPRTLAYGPDPDQHGELWATGGDRGTAVLLHGGFWRERYGAQLMHPLCARLAAHGWTVWNVEYRRMTEGRPASWPDPLLDVAAAIDHLPQALGALPPAPLVAISHSAGGQLALWSAARPRLPTGAPGADPAVLLDGAVGQAAVADLRMALDARLGRDAALHLLGGGSAPELERRLRLSSPAELLPLGVPLLLVHGDADEDVPIALARRFVARARAAGDRVELRELSGAGHFEHLDPDSAAWAAVERWLDERRADDA